MTEQETIKTMAVLKAAYPMFYRDMKQADAMSIVKLWNTVLADYPYQVVNAAIIALISTRTQTFPPVPGEVVAQIHKITKPQEMDGSEAWALVSKAVRNSAYGYHEEFQKLPPDVQRAVGDEYQLKEWATMDSQEFATVVASNFIKAYRIRSERDKEYQRLPSNIRDFIGNMLSAGTLAEMKEENLLLER